jgi:molecular chaperone DnaK (HSP70)
LRAGAADGNDGPCIGIDLGTTYSCVAVWRNGRVEICANEQGNRITPSYLAFLADGSRLVGDAAKNQATSNPTGTFFDVKRLIGRKFSDATVQTDKALFPFIIESDDAGKPVLKLPPHLTSKHTKITFAPEEMSGMVLRKMKETAETYLGTPVTRAVVTVPAYFVSVYKQYSTSPSLATRERLGTRSRPFSLLISLLTRTRLALVSTNRMMPNDKLPKMRVRLLV